MKITAWDAANGMYHKPSRCLGGKTVRRMFEDEDGVLQWGTPETRRKCGYITMRIPESVLLRVHRKRTQRAS